ncbi:MAG: serine/threonine-protein kinase [Myxococcales bacterium]
MDTDRSSHSAEFIESALEDRPYQVLESLGRGGVGSVWRVKDRVTERYLALKVMHHHLVNDPFFTDRFRLEAEAMASLEHPNIPAVVDYWVAEDGRHCLLLELLEGRTLYDEIAQRTRLPIGEVVDTVCQLLDALAATHAAGLVHRDIKPENLFLHHDGEHGKIRVKLLDFGLIRVLPTKPAGRLQPMMPTQSGSVITSPRFASPEALLGRRIDQRADIYSVGVVMYVCLVGLYSGFDMATGPTFSPPSELGVEGCTQELDEVILRAVDSNPDQRFQTAEEFLRALAPHRPVRNEQSNQSPPSFLQIGKELWRKYVAGK